MFLWVLRLCVARRVCLVRWVAELGLRSGTIPHPAALITDRILAYDDVARKGGAARSAGISVL